MLDWSEYAALGEPCAARPDRETNFGYPLLIDMADERNPKVASKIFSEVTLPENCAAVSGDSASFPSNGLTKGDVFGLVGSRVFLYDSHYCSTDRLHDPTIVACSSFGSGVRVYDIRDPRAPHEIAYYNPGVVQTPDGSSFVANATIARPVIRSDLGQIWFPDISKGFHVVQFRDGVWPFAGTDPCPHVDYYLDQYDLGYRDCRKARKKTIGLPSARVCRSRRSFTIHLRRPAHGRIARARVYVNGKLKKTVRGARARIDLRGLPARTYTVRVVVTTTLGRTITETRRYRTCVPSARKTASASALSGRSTGFVRAAYYCRVVGAHPVAAS
jgi:hypothetical protein